MLVLIMAEHERGTNEVFNTLLGVFDTEEQVSGKIQSVIDGQTGEFEVLHENGRTNILDEFGNTIDLMVFDTSRDYYIVTEGGDALFYDAE